MLEFLVNVVVSVTFPRTGDLVLHRLCCGAVHLLFGDITCQRAVSTNLHAHHWAPGVLRQHTLLEFPVLLLLHLKFFHEELVPALAVLQGHPELRYVHIHISVVQSNIAYVQVCTRRRIPCTVLLQRR